MSLATKYSECGDIAQYPFIATSLEPLKYNKVTYTWYDTDKPALVEFFMDTTLVFRHVYTYDDDGDLIEMTIE